MAEIANASDQLGITFELYGRTGKDISWRTASLKMQYRPKSETRFKMFVEGIVEIYDSDLSRLREALSAFLKATDQSKNFKFVPVAEPSFELAFERIPHGDDYCRVVLMAIDLKTIIEVNTPTADGENRITMRFHTTEDQIQKFGADLLTLRP